jgi:hypothetical protein
LFISAGEATAPSALAGPAAEPAATMAPAASLAALAAPRAPGAIAAAADASMARRRAAATALRALVRRAAVVGGVKLGLTQLLPSSEPLSLELGVAKVPPTTGGVGSSAAAGAAGRLGAFTSNRRALPRGVPAPSPLSTSIGDTSIGDTHGGVASGGAPNSSAPPKGALALAPAAADEAIGSSAGVPSAHVAECSCVAKCPPPAAPTPAPHQGCVSRDAASAALLRRLLPKAPASAARRRARFRRRCGLGSADGEGSRPCSCGAATRRRGMASLSAASSRSAVAATAGDCASPACCE